MPFFFPRSCHRLNFTINNKKKNLNKIKNNQSPTTTKLIPFSHRPSSPPPNALLCVRHILLTQYRIHKDSHNVDQRWGRCGREGVGGATCVRAPSANMYANYRLQREVVRGTAGGRLADPLTPHNYQIVLSQQCRRGWWCSLHIVFIYPIHSPPMSVSSLQVHNGVCSVWTSVRMRVRVHANVSRCMWTGVCVCAC